MEPLIKFTLCKQHKHDNIFKNALVFEDSWFVFNLQAFIIIIIIIIIITPKQWILIQSIYKGSSLCDKKTYNSKTKAVIFKS